jgi:hypothetical protein
MKKHLTPYGRWTRRQRTFDRIATALENLTGTKLTPNAQLYASFWQERELVKALRDHIAHGPTDKCLVGSPEFNARFDPRQHCSVCNASVIS